MTACKNRKKDFLSGTISAYFPNYIAKILNKAQQTTVFILTKIIIYACMQISISILKNMFYVLNMQSAHRFIIPPRVAICYHLLYLFMKNPVSCTEVINPND